MENVEALNSSEMEYRFKLLHYKVQSQRLEKTWLKFEEAGFNPILIKGWAAAQLYPHPFERQYSDIDLIVAPEQFAEAEEFQKKNSFDAAVDLHKGARHLDSLPFEDLYKNSVLKKCESVFIRTLREEDNLRILCVHWLNDGGADKERLWDIYHGINSRSEHFDWDRFLGRISAKRKRWIVCAIGLAHRYLNLNIADTPIANEGSELPDWLIKTVEKEWESGVRLIPLSYVMHDRKRFWQQIRKRLPPNPIQATIELEGSFDRNPRFMYQLGDIFFRLPASLKRYFSSKSHLLRKFLENHE